MILSSNATVSGYYLFDKMRDLSSPSAESIGLGQYTIQAIQRTFSPGSQKWKHTAVGVHSVPV